MTSRFPFVSSPSIDCLDPQIDWSRQSLTALLRSNIVPVADIQRITLFAENTDAQVAALDVQLKALNVQRAALVWRATAARSLLSPVRLLPDELLLHTFSFVSYDISSIPMRVASVCKRWHDVVYSAPSLWCNLRLPSCKVPLSIIDAWMERSLPMPLNMQLGLRSTPESRSIELVSKLPLYGRRIQTLRLSLRRHHFKAVNALPHDSFPALEALALDLDPFGSDSFGSPERLVTRAFAGSRMLRRLAFIMHTEAFHDVNQMLLDFPFAQITDAFIYSSPSMIFKFVQELKALRTAAFVTRRPLGQRSPFTELVDLPIDTLELQGTDYSEPFWILFSLPGFREFLCNLMHSLYSAGFSDLHSYLFDHSPLLDRVVRGSTSITRLVMRSMDEWLSVLDVVKGSPAFESIQVLKISVYEDLSLWPRFMEMLTYHPTSSVLPLFPRLQVVVFDIRLSRRQETEVERIDDSLAAMILSRWKVCPLVVCHYLWMGSVGRLTVREHFSAQLQSCFDDGLVMEGFA
ncbi:hypothetical protein FISHEDRAFT_73312 [Fistulina hepatica ATCC 64428]|uniref:F-box domain-containing protein n=1 Tax=Fistulina hepatica ATCC 64428 TaxID=1128425 RepID=A0A0D7AD17_9AGAR|nr:hypothetical protein FISHEDRAFT_73312 [Fistulina hepatica ATCC 64428]